MVPRSTGPEGQLVRNAGGHAKLHTFADEQDFSIDDVTYGHVRAFIYEADLAKTIGW